MISFTVYGTPIPQGSMKAFRHKTTGAVITTSDNTKTKPWKQQVSLMAINAVGTVQIKGPVQLDLKFFLKRPKSVSKSRVYPTVKPDLDKCTRAILDALSGIVYRDDAQVVRFGEVSKEYGEPERVEITVEEL